MNRTIDRRAALSAFLGLLLSSVVLCFGVGCSDLTTSELDCTWLNDNNNCWKEALAEIQACAPAGSGSLSGSMCTYGDGSQVNFSSSVDLNANDYSWDFTLTSPNGSTCLTFEELGGGESMSVTTNSGAVTVISNDLDLSISCPDGSSFEIDDTSKLFDQCTMGFEFLPGNASQRGPEGASFSLTGGRSGTVPVFNCR